MTKSRFIFENRFAELGKDDYEGRKELLEFFETTVRPQFDSGDVLDGCNNIKREIDQQNIYHLCYDCNIDLWRQVYYRVRKIADNCELYINWEQIKHVLRFTFLRQPPGGFFLPHHEYHLLSLSAFNIPLKGKTEVAFYKNKEEEIGRHEYINPCILNTNKFHAVFNDTDQDRLILKTHLTVVPWDKVVNCYEKEKQFNLFDESVPWEEWDYGW
jgi:hypothetical protein